MQAKKFIISDTHFGHRRVLDFEAALRPFKSIEEHDNELVRRWNSVVRPEDTVWHLGDVYFGGRHAHRILGRLNGIKNLVLGNHDHYPMECYAPYFNKIYGAHVDGDCIFTHVPVHESQLEYRFKYNIHGHMHSKKLKDSRYACVSVEQINLTPILLSEVLKQLRENK